MARKGMEDVMSHEEIIRAVEITDRLGEIVAGEEEPRVVACALIGALAGMIYEGDLDEVEVVTLLHHTVSSRRTKIAGTQ